MDYVEIAHGISNRIATKLEKKHHMKAMGTAGGMMGNIYMMGISFDIRRPLTQQEGRKIIVSCVEEYLQAINNNVDVRPDLAEYPFPAKNIKMTLFIKDKNGDKLYDPEISVISTSEGTITYRTNDPDNEYRYKNRIHENYEDALAIVKKEAPELLPN